MNAIKTMEVVTNFVSIQKVATNALVIQASC